MTRRQQKTPAFTTATAWSRALTGVGATMAEGSHSWRGMIAALVPKPMMKVAKMMRRSSAEPFPATNPPATKSRVPVR